MKLLISMSIMFSYFYCYGETTQSNKVINSFNQFRKVNKPQIPASYFQSKRTYSQFKKQFNRLTRLHPSLLKSKKALEHGLAFYMKRRYHGLNQCGGDKKASPYLKNHDWIAITDYTRKNTESRMYFINMKTGKLIEDLAAHGKGSGANQPIPTDISDKDKSKKTNGGFFETGHVYTSRKDGRPKKTFGGKPKNAIKLRGLNPSNKNSYSPRGIVFHGATYVNNRRAGNSWGCPAVQVDTFYKVRDSLKDGAIMYLHTVEQDKLDQPEC